MLVSGLPRQKRQTHPRTTPTHRRHTLPMVRQTVRPITPGTNQPLVPRKPKPHIPIDFVFAIWHHYRVVSDPSCVTTTTGGGNR